MMPYFVNLVKRFYKVFSFFSNFFCPRRVFAILISFFYSSMCKIFGFYEILPGSTRWGWVRMTDECEHITPILGDTLVPLALGVTRRRWLRGTAFVSSRASDKMREKLLIGFSQVRLHWEICSPTL